MYLGVVHEAPGGDAGRRGSDGESEEASGASDDVTPAVKMRHKARRRLTQEDINKRLSLPADLRVPEAFLQKQELRGDAPLSRVSRRKSLAELGFGRMETYTKLDKLGEVGAASALGVGCIMYEMISGRPLFPGATVEDELHLIFRTLGTPTEETWPGVEAMPEFNMYRNVHHPGEPLITKAPRLGQDSALSLLKKFLLYEAKKRISAASATKHPFFESLGPAIHRLGDQDSLFSCPGVMLTKDHNAVYRSSNGTQSRNRRQSLCSLMDESDDTVHNIDENGSPRPFVFDPKPCDDEDEETEADATLHSSYARDTGGWPSGSRHAHKMPVVRCSSGSSVPGIAICRCNSDLRLPVRQHNRDNSLHDLSSNSHSCNACYNYELRASSSSCLYKYDDYVEYTESPYVNRSPYTAHYETPPLSSHSPPIASSPSHSYYSPSDSYTTPTENIRPSGAAEESVFAALQSLSSIQNYSCGMRPGNILNGIGYNSSGGLSSSRYEVVCNAGTGGTCSCGNNCAALGNCIVDTCGQDLCDDPCKESCGGRVCCTSIRSDRPPVAPRTARSNSSSSSKQSFAQTSPRGDSYARQYYAAQQRNKKSSIERSLFKESKPNWKSIDSARGDPASPAPPVSSSKSEGLLCTEL
ncbi:hypothetical protein HAZT_HAZT007658 [Hyalella azteca]|uniref:Protein kinase domain-containing protein n=1 Tax=Hyalella azteca TaxID=294128 RepID=A0A6A0H2J0_HYAAZ|nr:hypothetical protein HAZT_HAZT007658 [Hyalella azteca]